MKLQIELTGAFSQDEAASLLTEALQRLSLSWPPISKSTEPVSFTLYDDDGSTVGKVWLFPVPIELPHVFGKHNAKYFKDFPPDV